MLARWRKLGREGLHGVFIHSLSVSKDLKTSQSYSKAWKERDGELAIGRKHTREDLCFHQGAVLFYNGQQCISGVVNNKMTVDPSK